MNVIMKKIKERMTGNAWNNLGQLNWTLPKLHYIKKVTIPHMANINVCRYSHNVSRLKHQQHKQQ